MLDRRFPGVVTLLLVASLPLVVSFGFLLVGLRDSGDVDLTALINQSLAFLNSGEGPRLTPAFVESLSVLHGFLHRLVLGQCAVFVLDLVGQLPQLSGLFQELLALLEELVLELFLLGVRDEPLVSQVDLAAQLVVLEPELPLRLEEVLPVLLELVVAERRMGVDLGLDVPELLVDEGPLIVRAASYSA